MKERNFIYRYIFLLFFVCSFFCATSYDFNHYTKNRLLNLHYKRGLEFYRLNNYDKASSEFEKVLEIDPNNKKAKKYCDVIQKKKNKAKIKSLFQQAKELIRQRQYRQALDVYKSVQELAPNDGYSRFQIEYLEDKINKLDRHYAKIEMAKKAKEEKIRKQQIAKRRKEQQIQERLQKKQLRIQSKKENIKKQANKKTEELIDPLKKAEIMSKELEKANATLQASRDMKSKKQQAQQELQTHSKNDKAIQTPEKTLNDRDTLKKMEEEMAEILKR